MVSGLAMTRLWREIIFHTIADVESSLPPSHKMVRFLQTRSGIKARG
jgi:hypothetical protein